MLAYVKGVEAAGIEAAACGITLAALRAPPPLEGPSAQPTPRRGAGPVAGVSSFVASTRHGTPPWGMIAMLALFGYAGVVAKFSALRSIIVSRPLNADMK